MSKDVLTNDVEIKIKDDSMGSFSTNYYPEGTSLKELAADISFSESKEVHYMVKDSVFIKIRQALVASLEDAKRLYEIELKECCDESRRSMAILGVCKEQINLVESVIHATETDTWGQFIGEQEDA